MAGTKRRSQVTGYRAQVAENSIKRVRHSIRLLMFIFVSVLVVNATIRHMFAIDHAVRFFEVRKQHLLTSYFGLSSTEELENDLANYQHTSQTIDCAAIMNCRFQFVAAYIDVLVVINLSNGYSWDDSSHSYEIVMGS